ncbi:hypothetical protein L6452_15355 [Arctium lappa]|uniref:Uncharacterized protein n=1 Tax=Arctium lappa TaxID=4217 RepID=A0ACB9CNK3_ARCLA|nr:hypothetical protein L6452_15355 [Arctium lappa]
MERLYCNYGLKYLSVIDLLPCKYSVGFTGYLCSNFRGLSLGLKKETHYSVGNRQTDRRTDGSGPATQRSFISL